MSVLGGTFWAGAQEKAWIEKAQYAKVQVVTADVSGEELKEISQVFAEYWEKSTGHKATRGYRPNAGALNVYIFWECAPFELVKEIDLPALGEEGVAIVSGQCDGSPALLITGFTPRSTMNAVYEFFDRYMGVRWLAPGATYIPGAPERLPQIRYQFAPVFEYRDTTYLTSAGLPGPELAEYRRAHHVYPGPGFSCHTFYAVFPPEKYFREHPEYYALLNGKRTAPLGFDWSSPELTSEQASQRAQLCCSNPEVAEVAYTYFDEQIRLHPERRTVHLSQMDWVSNCECDECRAIDDREGTPMGPVLTLINRIADRMAQEHPGYTIETLAYWYTRKPPKFLKPRDNVIIKLCSIECDFGRPLDDPKAELNVSFADDIRKWSKVAKRLHIWDYTPNYAYYQTPHPNFHVLQPNAQFFANHKVRGLFEQGAETYGSEFSFLRAYLVHRVMWNPDRDLEADMNEFLELYYRESAPYIRKYIDLMTQTLKASGKPMTCFDNAVWLTPEFVEQGNALFEQALAAAKTDEIRARVRLERLAIRFAALACPPELTVDRDSMSLAYPPAPTLEEFIEETKALKVPPMPPFHDSYMKGLKARLGDNPRQGLDKSPVVVLENERYVLWTVPAAGGAILRWTDKKFGVELLRGYETYGRGGGSWQDWTNTPGLPEKAVALKYDLVEQSPSAVLMRGNMEQWTYKTVQAGSEARVRSVENEGLVTERRIEFTPDGQGVQLTLSVRNTGTEAVAPSVKVHPEFFLQTPQTPEVWAKKSGQWERLNSAPGAQAPAFGARLDPGFGDIALRMPKKSLAVVATFDPKELEAVQYFYSTNPDAMHGNLELIMSSAPLAPGESRSVSAVFRVTNAKPSKGFGL